ncbi:MurR/RpiR family transcriptional regulator [Enterococcus gilvus]|uniref:MurR/RpiR family transcriptional regulator n=1 Tax=Enterococcus gilvus TaxID=160453 RepID=UPI003D6A1C72
MQNNYDELSSTEQLALDYILKYSDLGGLKLKVIQDALHISAPTVIRAIKKIDFKTFTEFKYALLNENKQQEQDAAETDYQSILTVMREDFDKTIAMMDEDTVKEIARAILSARRIFCVGIGSSANVANAFNHKLKNLGLWSNDYTEVFPIRDIPEIARAEDCIIVFSLSGGESQIVKVMSECKVKGCHILSVTGFSSNPIVSLSDISLRTHQSVQNRKKLRSRLMQTVASEVIFETVLLLSKQ